MAITKENLPQNTQPLFKEPVRHSGSPRPSGVVDMGGHMSPRPSGVGSSNPPGGTAPRGPGVLPLINTGDEMGYNRIVKVISAASK